MKNLQNLEELNLFEIESIKGGNWLFWVAVDVVDFLIDEYPNYVATDCYGKGCGIGMGTSGNTPFTGW